MATSRDRLSIFENIIARVGLDGPVLEEYSKAMSTLNGLQTMTEMTPPPVMPPQGQNMANTPQLGQNGMAVPPMDMGGGNGLNMP